MNRCARTDCGRTVYPLEELRCLDKIWHKTCFKCTVCGTILNMKSYKGYEKNPYCEPHYPRTVASVVADTPEMRRLAENTKLQSQVHYHADFEKMKGSKIQVPNDPETARLLANTKAQSHVNYTGEANKRLEQEQLRPHIPTGADESNPYAPVLCSSADRKKMTGKLGAHEPKTVASEQPTATIQSHSSTENGSKSQPLEAENPKYPPVPKPPESAKVELAKTLLSHSERRTSLTNSTVKPKPVPIPKKFEQANDALIPDSPYSKRQNNYATMVYSSDNDFKAAQHPTPSIGSIFDYDPLNNAHGSYSSKAPPASVTPAKESSTGFKVKAVYDYTAADKDEVSFVEGDIIVNCQKIDDGWMTGTVQRTRNWGMLPSNYVEEL